MAVTCFCIGHGKLWSLFVSMFDRSWVMLQLVQESLACWGTKDRSRPMNKFLEHHLSMHMPGSKEGCRMKGLSETVSLPIYPTRGQVCVHHTLSKPHLWEYVVCVAVVVVYNMDNIKISSAFSSLEEYHYGSHFCFWGAFLFYLCKKRSSLFFWVTQI